MKRLQLILFVTLLNVASVKAQAWYRLGDINALGKNAPFERVCTDIYNNVYATIYPDSVGLNKFNVAEWDGSSSAWIILGGDTGALNANGFITTICADKFGNVYAAGVFTDSTDVGTPIGGKFVAKWNGSNWSKLGVDSNALNANYPINTICADDSGNIYAAGNFYDSFGYNYVAKWNGVKWVELGSNFASQFIYSICVDDSFNVYAGGDLKDSAGHSCIAKYSPATNEWRKIGSSFDSANTLNVIVLSVVVDTLQNVYAAINFEDSNSASWSNVFEWSGTSWNQLGNLNANNWINSLCLSDSGFLYGAGAFTDSIGNVYVAKWNPSSSIWSMVGSDFDSASVIPSLCIGIDHSVYAGVLPQIADNYVVRFGPPLKLVEQAKSIHTVIEYPNPTTGDIYLLVDDLKFIGETYVLYNDVGNVCLEGRIRSPETHLNLFGLASGTYIFKIGVDNKIELKIYKI